MPEVSVMFPQLEDMAPGDLLTRRSALLAEIKAYPKADDAPEPLLHELLAITRMLRRKTAGPPKAKKDAKPTAKVNAADLMDGI